MTQSSHTPGPWRVKRNQTPGQFVTSEKVCDAHNSVVCNLHVNADANGRLIAAAPDLLAALQNLLAHEGEEETNAIGITSWTEARRDAIYEAETVIAKVKGT